MAMTLTGSEGFFTRQGAIIGEYNRVTVFYGTGLNNGFQSIWTQFASTDQAAVRDLNEAVELYRTSPLAYLASLQAAGQLAMILQADRDASLVPYSVETALRRVVAQMKSTSQTINRPTITATITTDSGNLGDTVIRVGTKNEFGDQLDMIHAETINVRCTADPGTSYIAPLEAVGEATRNRSDWNWPGGSGSITTLTVVDGNNNGIISDGGFNLWSGTGSNTPDSWEIINGDVGVTIFRNAGAGLRGLHALRITSNGTQATQIGQDVDLNVNQVYCVAIYAKVSSLTPTGTFRIALCDNNGNIINDDAGNPLSYTQNLNGELTTSYQCFTAFFSTPRQLPITTRVQFGLSAASPSGHHLDLSLASLTPATQLYQGGPYVAAISGQLRTAFNDKWKIVMTNSLSTKSFARGFDRVYGIRSLGIYFPSSTSPTISDALVTN